MSKKLYKATGRYYYRVWNDIPKDCFFRAYEGKERQVLRGILAKRLGLVFNNEAYNIKLGKSVRIGEYILPVSEEEVFLLLNYDKTLVAIKDNDVANKLMVCYDLGWTVADVTNLIDRGYEFYYEG